MAAVEYPIDKEAVYEFLLRNLSDRVSIEGFAYEPQKLGGLYWTLTAISILKGNVKEIVHPKLNRKLEEVATDVIGSSRNADGGFGNAPGHPSCIIATHVGYRCFHALSSSSVRNPIAGTSGQKRRDR